MFRPEIKVVDCTIRDGGLINNWDFSLEMVRDVYLALSKAGVDYMETGYKADKSIFPPSESGMWRYCDEPLLREMVDGTPSDMGIATMVDVGRVNLDDILPKTESVIDLYRVATYVQDIDKAIFIANHCHDKGYKTTINIMAISKALLSDLEEALRQVEAETQVLACYVVDSFGALYCEQIELLVKTYRQHLKTREVGVHAHNNQQLAYANTIEGIIHDANFVDATIYGIGRAAGNCPLELLLSFLKNPKFDVRPIFDVISKWFIPLSKKEEWGYLIPYMITGSLNEHPRAAINLLKSDDREDFSKFYESIAHPPEIA